MSTMQPARAVVAPSTVETLASVTGWALSAIAAVVLCGWTLSLSELISVVPGQVSMKPNTALAFLFTGLALLRRKHRDVFVYALGVTIIGAATLVEYLFHSNLGIDQLLFQDPSPAIYPGRMSQLTSVGFTFLGPSLLLMKAGSETARRISRGLGLLAGALGVVVVLGYSYDTRALYQVRPYASVALHTALAFVIAALGVYCANPGEGLVARIHAGTAGGSMLRRLLPAALLIPYLLGFIVWMAQKHLRWEIGSSLALVVASVMLCLIIIMLFNAKRLEREELAVRESQERFRLIANTAPVMIWMSGTDKLCSYFNQPWLEFTGRPVETELGNGWAQGVHTEDLKSCMETYTEAFDRREPFQMQYRLRRHDGEYRWILDIGVPRFEPDGSFAGYLGSCIDITDRKLAEEALADIGRKLIEVQEQERAWIARELHDDINQRIALLAIELEKWDQHIPRSAIDTHDHIRQVHQRLSDVGRDIQVLSHHLHSSRLDYLGIVVAASSFCKELSQQQKVEIDFSHAGVPQDVPKEISLCLFRVLQEALQNAVKHSGVRHFKVELTGNSAEIQLTVSDEGGGFNQQDPTRRQGLGLISMHERVQMVNGHFSIKSQPGHGTIIKARIPLLRAETAVSSRLSGGLRTAS